MTVSDSNPFGGREGAEGEDFGGRGFSPLRSSDRGAADESSEAPGVPVSSSTTTVSPTTTSPQTATTMTTASSTVLSSTTTTSGRLPSVPSSDPLHDPLSSGPGNLSEGEAGADPPRGGDDVGGGGGGGGGGGLFGGSPFDGIGGGEADYEDEARPGLPAAVDVAPTIRATSSTTTSPIVTSLIVTSPIVTSPIVTSSTSTEEEQSTTLSTPTVTTSTTPSVSTTTTTAPAAGDGGGGGGIAGPGGPGKSQRYCLPSSYYSEHSVRAQTVM